MRQILHRDIDGVESIPLKLIIVILVLAIIIPSFFIGLAAYSNSQTENNIRSEIDRIVSIIKQTYDGDEGTSFSLSINIEEGIFKKFEYVKIGDRIGEHGGPYQCIIRYKFYNEDVRYVVIENPNIMTTSPLNAAFEMGSGKQTIIAEKHVIADTGFVVVRKLDEGIEFKMADVAIYDKDIEITLNNGFLERVSDSISGKIINATIHNVGNLDTGDPNAKWSGDGKVRVRFLDHIIMKNETRQIGDDVIIENIPSESSVIVHPTVTWSLLGPDDDPQDPELRKREIRIWIDALDNVDELTAKNNIGKTEYIDRPPTIDNVTDEVDLYLLSIGKINTPWLGPGMGGVESWDRTGDEFWNTVVVIASDPDDSDRVERVAFWYGDKSYPEDKYDPSSEDITPEDGFSVTILMEQFLNMDKFTIKAYDSGGLGGDPETRDISMLTPNSCTDHITRNANEKGEKNYDFDIEKMTFKLAIDVPADLIKGFKKAFGGEIPFISDLDNAMNNSYKFEIEIPIGADVNFRKETDLAALLFGKGGSDNLDINAWVDVNLHLGMDKNIEINLSKIFDLIEDTKWLSYYYDEMGDILSHLESDWNVIKNPDNAFELISALEDVYDNLDESYEVIKETISRIKTTLESFKDCFNELKSLWQSIMNHEITAESILSLISFKADAGITLGWSDSWEILSIAYPILPPFVTAHMKAGASAGVSFSVTGEIQADLEGLDFLGVEVDSEVTFGLTISFDVCVGVDFGFAAGGIRGEVTGGSDFALNAGLDYSTIEGITKEFWGDILIWLEATLDAYARFLWYEETWEFWSDKWDLGHWYFDLVGDSYDNTIPPTEKEVEEEVRKNIKIPTGPSMDCNSSGGTITIESQDLESDPEIPPDYEIMYSFDNGNSWTQLTHDNKIDGDPKVIYNSTDSAFVFWTQSGDNTYLTDTELEISDILKDSELFYAIYTNGSWNGPFQFTSNSMADIQPELSAGSDGSVTVTWIRDSDADISTEDDKDVYYSIWNGSAWSTPIQKPTTNSINYDNKMAPISDGRIVSVWIHDEDENMFTTSDQQLEYSIWSNDQWSDPISLTYDNSSKESLSLGGNENEIILVWLNREDYNWTINTKVWNITTDLWSTTEIFNRSTSLIQSPQVTVTQDGIAVLIWRSNYDVLNWSNAAEGYVYYSTKDLKDISNWTNPRILTSTNIGWDFQSTMTLYPNGTLVYSYYNFTGPVDNQTQELQSVILELKPDLMISKIGINGSNQISANEGDMVDVTALITNLGDVKSEIVNVSFYNGDPNDDGEIIDWAILSNIDRLGSSEVTIDWQVVKGIHDIFVVADSDNAIHEHTESNNRDYCTVISIPNLKIGREDISFSPTNPSEGDLIQISAKIYNKGYSQVENVTIYFYDGNPMNQGSLIGTQTIYNIGVDQFQEATITWTMLSGKHEIFIKVETSDEEIEIKDNTASNMISALPDLSIGNGDITLSKSEITENTKTTISAIIHNIGVASAENVIVKFSSSDSYIGYKIINVSVGSSTSISIDWTPNMGSHLIYVASDPGNQIEEVNEGNNVHYEILTVFSSVDLSMDLKVKEKSSGIITITANVKNDEVSDISNIEVNFYEGEPGSGGILINTTTISQINGLSSADLSFEWQTPPGRITIYAIVDEMNLIRETDETNNVQSKTIDVKGESSDENIQWPLILLIIGIIAVPAIIIIFHWRRRLSH